MNIDIEKLKQAIELLSVLDGNESKLVGKRVIVRSRMAGVMYGTLESVCGQHVVLTNARIIWRWRNAKKGIALNDTAKYGLMDDDYSNLSAFNDRLEMLEACSIIECSDEAIISLDTRKVFNGCRDD